MSIQTQTMSTTSTALTTCPRCGKQLLNANIACNQRSCRPVALRRVLLVALASQENDTDQQSKPAQSDRVGIQ